MKAAAPKRPTVTAPMLLALLAAKHSQDVFVPECKTGGSMQEHGRFDAFAMAKSWAHPMATGYEIKVSRQDFLRDVKWRQYLPACNRFFFVAPSGVIDPSEVPEGAGLLLTSQGGTKLFTKRQAPYKAADPVALAAVLQYVLFWRVPAVAAERYPVSTREMSLAYWEAWMADRKFTKDLGWKVGKALREAHQRDVVDVQARQQHLENEVRRLAHVDGWLKALDIGPGTWRIEDRLRAKAAELSEAFPADLVATLHAARHNLDQLLAKVADAKAKAAAA